MVVAHPQFLVQCAPLSWQWLLLTEWRGPDKAIGGCDRRCQEAMLDRIITLGDNFVGRRDRGRWKERVEGFQSRFLSSSGASY